MKTTRRGLFGLLAAPLLAWQEVPDKDITITMRKPAPPPDHWLLWELEQYHVRVNS